jgi:hypothetical protein
MELMVAGLLMSGSRLSRVTLPLHHQSRILLLRMERQSIRVMRKSYDLHLLGKFHFHCLSWNDVDFNRPAYSGLTNNVSTKLQKLKDFPWKEGTSDFVNVRAKQEYIQSYSKHFGVEPLIRYNTRVEKLEKVGRKWLIKSTTLIREGPTKGKHVNEVEVSVENQAFGPRLTI